MSLSLRVPWVDTDMSYHLWTALKNGTQGQEVLRHWVLEVCSVHAPDYIHINMNTILKGSVDGSS